MPVDWPWGILIKQYFWMCVTTFWVRLAIESIDSGKQISFPNIGRYFEELNRAKGRKSRNSPFWSDSLLELEHLIFSYSGLRLNYTWIIHFLGRISHPLKSCEPIPHNIDVYTSVQFSSPVAQSCPTLCDPTNRSTSGLPVHHQLLESTQTHVHCVSDAIQPSHPLLSPSSPALNLSQHQGLFKWICVYIHKYLKTEIFIGCFCVENCNISIFQICPCSDQL